MSFTNYLEEENDKPYFTKNSLAYYYDKMEGFAEKVEGSAKALNLTKEEIEQRIALRLAEWDKNLESFDGSVEKLLTEWVDDGTLTHVIDSTLIDQKIAPVALQLEEKASKKQLEAMGSGTPKLVVQAVSNLPSSVATGDERLALVLDDGHKYYFDGVSWIDAGVYQAFELGDKSITAAKTTFAVESLNLFNKNDITNQVGKYFSKSGNIVDLATGFVSHAIPAMGGDVFRMMYDGAFVDNSGVFYDKNNVLIGVITGIPNTERTFREFTVPLNSNITHVRLHASWSKRNEFMVVKNTPYPSSYIPFEKTLSDEFKLNNTQKVQVVTILNEQFDSPAGAELNPLYGKVAIFDGDSICNGSSAADGLSGWAGRIGTKNSMTWQNYGINGATVTAEVYRDGGGARHWVSRNIDVMRSDADYIILEGGINDYSLRLPIGTIAHNYTAAMDDTTFSGALESLFRKALLKYQGKKVGFIIPHKMAGTYYPYGGAAEGLSEVYWKRVREICEKWSIPYIDLFKESGLISALPEIEATFFANDTWHLNSAGYDVITPKIEAWMKTL